jgi:hypothetical protein
MRDPRKENKPSKCRWISVPNLSVPSETEWEGNKLTKMRKKKQRMRKRTRKRKKRRRRKKKKKEKKKPWKKMMRNPKMTN